MITQSASTTEWQNQFTNFTRMAGGIFPLAQSRLEDMIDWAAQNNRNAAELMREAMEACLVPFVFCGMRRPFLSVLGPKRPYSIIRVPDSLLWN